jgi:hypothetical protein
LFFGFDEYALTSSAALGFGDTGLDDPPGISHLTET